VRDLVFGDPLGSEFGAVLVHDVLHTGGCRTLLEPCVLAVHTWNRSRETPDVDDVCCVDLVAGSLDFTDQVLVRVRSVLTSACVRMGRGVGGCSVMASARMSWMGTVWRGVSVRVRSRTMLVVWGRKW
jgi:hypothetical protein